MKKIPLIILTGPTAVGKTELSINLAKSLDADIISADSMQIYEYMDIGSAKVTKEEMNGVTHYLIDEVKPNYAFSVSEFQSRANKYIEKIHQEGKNILVTGGTGLYLNSLIYNMDFAKSDANNELRDKLQQELKENGIDYMHQKLKELDSDAADRIHKNNTKRVIRALEVCLSGEKMNDFSNDLRFNEKYEPIIIVLNREREHLYERINKRVDIMMDCGLIDEVKNLLSMGYTKDMISMQGIGYKEIIKYLDGEYTLDEAVEIIKRDSRRYAKRQLTWFRRYKDAKWFNLDEYSDKKELEKEVNNYIEKRLQLV
ncbi:MULTISPECIES: tRNA (adenosine(37)-N6)-dimethylallyltransferase MiaA [unclassified Romboutsia]|uniref:tRNA (adenosine(37)-N6)-dimethylallyltransferase MiaA n=1 Tax=unclassified Romboutsia TaxID=2626894 RepID=UPI001897BA64|nr:MULTISPECIES: tRNA (adenosine(37)-N6)-dimethylallyltransferase MiaA [unclassified Romboutsia]MDB8805949.1 tRNA (adenosine(37)-N6)-dimethylallyltransferase MiaA [Romboutsia sp. 1001216sp1]MDB8807607.1 tRNA (adenosine(37)-N6)-dimethylallyltransferase MiaA [Romboutsia sp. 1001216sp1]MDB8811230.1 tRNA (adenosine(37)-N6)-dimethylallyltransferase MiaA [Romboutsia sp. 1001216sp1]MDB8816950.1 tRNA (adenosine(37)-N6)-dimethylallyltransferase MiaA [Romboutsia sp. 1001216sp1]MDB8819532.1 tRNA (adenosi